MDFASYDVVSRYYSYALQYYKNSKDEIQWLPICGMPQTIIANKTLFEQFGIKIPENYKEYAQACQQFYDNGIKPYSLDLAEDWSAHEVIQTGAIGEFMSLDGIEWRSSAESASGDIAFDDALWKRIFSETNTFLKDSHFTSDDISVDINTAAQMFLEGKAAMFHGYPALMQEYQEQMDAELLLISSSRPGTSSIMFGTSTFNEITPFPSAISVCPSFEIIRSRTSNARSSFMIMV